MRSNYFLILVLFSFFSCVSSNSTTITSNKSIVITNEAGVADYAPLFKAAIERALLDGSGVVTIKQGQYAIKSMVWNGNLPKSLTIKGEGEVELLCTSRFGSFTAPSEVKRLEKVARRGDRRISVSASDDKISPKVTSVFLISDDIVEKSWKYKKGGVNGVLKVQDGIIELAAGLNFDYDPNKEKVQVKLYQPVQLMIQDVDFKLIQNEKGKAFSALRSIGCQIKLSKIGVSGPKDTRDVDFFNINSAPSVEAVDLTFKDLRYGALINYSRDVTINRIVANNVVHSVAPSTFTTNVDISNLRGSKTSIDAHVAFNVHYDDIEILEEGGFAVRAFGVKITNSKIVPAPGRDKVSRLSVQSLREPYKFLSMEHDVILRNVEYQGELSSRNGLNVFTCRNFVVDNCTTHEVSSSNRTESFTVSNSRIGRLRCYTNNFTVSNTAFVSTLQRRSKIKAPLWGSYGGQAQVEHCSFIGYDDTFLIGYMHDDRSTKYVFRDCFLEGFTGLVEKTNSAPETYLPLQFIDCKFKHKPPSEKGLGVPFTIQ